jgi:DNA-binding GntR family transcriptional regulator
MVSPRPNADSSLQEEAFQIGTAPSGLGPISRETVHEQVYRELRRALIYGQFMPGQVLNIRELATKLQVSTMPVRDALSRLMSERAVEARANRSVRVPLISASRLNDLKRVRLMIEGEALERAAPNLTAADFLAARLAIRDYDSALTPIEAMSVEGIVKANKSFHFRLYEASGSSVLLPFIESLWLQSGPMIRAAVAIYDPDGETNPPHYHLDIIEALERGDLARARRALELDISRGFRLLESLLSHPTGPIDAYREV